MSRKPVRHALEYAAFRVLAGVLRVLPEGLALRLGGALGWFAGRVLGLRRAAVDANLRLAFPDRDAAWRSAVARASWVHLGREAVAMFRMADLSPADLRARVEMDGAGLAALRTALGQGRGAVLVSGHLGNWEIGGAALAAHGVPVDAVAKGMANARFDADLVATRERLGLRVVDMGRAPREVLRSLRAGRAAALVADQNMHRGGLFVPFFGVPAATARGPALFALRTGAPVFLGVALRAPGWPQRYRIHLREVPFAPTGDLEADVRTLTEAHVRALEALVRDTPDQYFWQHKRWKTRPAGRGPAEEQAPGAAV